MTRILHIGPFVDTSDGQKLHPELLALNPQTGLRKALAALGEYRSLSWPQLLHGVGPRMLNWAIRGLAAEFKPDWTFIQEQNGDSITAETYEAIPGKVFSWSGDVRSPLPERYFARAPVVDCSSFSNLEDVEEMRAAGFCSEFLQVGFDPEHYWAGPQEGRHGIAFIGNNYHHTKFPGSAERLEMAVTLRHRFGARFKLYGSGWPKYLNPLGTVGEEAEASILRRVKIAVCQNHFIRGRYTSDRTFRSMGCGALVLQRRFPDMDRELGGHGYASWEDLGELCDAIDAFCENGELRSGTARDGAEFAHAHCTWERRVEEFAGIMRGLEAE